MAMTSPYGTIENVGIGTMRGDGRPSKKAAARELLAPVTGRWARLVEDEETNLRLRKAHLRWLREQQSLSETVSAADFRHSASPKAAPAAKKAKPKKGDADPAL